LSRKKTNESRHPGYAFHGRLRQHAVPSKLYFWCCELPAYHQSHVQGRRKTKQVKATIETGGTGNNFVYSGFLPMRGDVLEMDDGNATVAGVSCTQITVCGNLQGMLYMLELVGRVGRFQWRRSVIYDVTDPIVGPSLDELHDPDWKNG
jgi:hypothetical protein